MNSVPAVHLTMLSSMAGGEFERAVARHCELGIRVLDLKDGLWGHNVETIPEALAEKASSLIANSALRVECLSSSIGWSALDEGRENYLARHEPAFQHLLRIVPILRPRTVRLLAPPRPNGSSAAQTLANFPWIGAVFGDWIDRIRAAGAQAVIENEAHGCILADPADFHTFAHAIGRDVRATFILDAQNLWQCSGSAPSVAAVRDLAPLLGGLHLKGGRAGADGYLAEASALADASWPVTDVVRAALDLGVLHSICLNPSHGRRAPEFNGWETTLRDLAFLRTHFPILQ
jgi:hypothetical protein